MDLMNYSHSASLNINSIQAYFQKLCQPTVIYVFDIAVSLFFFWWGGGGGLGRAISACRAVNM